MRKSGCFVQQLTDTAIETRLFARAVKTDIRTTNIDSVHHSTPQPLYISISRSKLLSQKSIWNLGYGSSTACPLPSVAASSLGCRTRSVPCSSLPPARCLPWFAKPLHHSKMPTCSFPTRKGAVVFNTASRAKCRPSATTGKHKLSQDHRKKAPAPAPRAAKRAAPRAAPAPTTRSSTRTRRAPARYR